MIFTASKRVLILSLAYHPVVGGAEIAVREIISRIPTDEIEWDIITLRFDESHPAKEKIGNCTIYRISTSKNLYPFKALFLATKLHKVKPFDATWAIMANWAGLAALFFKFRFPQVPYILTLQEGDSFAYIRRKIWFVYPLFKQIFTRADVIQAISNYLADWAKQMGYKGRVEVIPNGVDLEKFKSVKHPMLDKGKVVLITTSRLVEKNAVGDIIDALKYLPESVELQILGVGPLEKDLKFKVKSLKLENRVKFLGNIPNSEVPLHLSRADIFVRPSLSEGQGISFIEAMSAGLPVVTTPVGGITDFLTDEETGLFCEVRSPESIAKQIKRLIADDDLRERIIENAKKMVKEKYDWDLITKEMRSKVFGKI